MATSPGKHTWIAWGAESSSDPEVIERWWRDNPRANVGIATGPSGLTVLDPDGPEGWAELEALVAKHGGILPHTLIVQAGGGKHASISPAAVSKLNRKKKVNTDLHVRGEGGMVVAPPSIHASGKVYQWVGEFDIEGLAEVPQGNQILVRLDLDLNGILKVTATERATGLAKHVVIDSATERFRQSQRTDAVDRLEAVFGTLEHPHRPHVALSGPDQNLDGTSSDDDMTPSLRDAVESAQTLVAKAKGLESDANDEDAEELRAMLADLQAAVERGSESDIRVALREVEELVFYLEDA